MKRSIGPWYWKGLVRLDSKVEYEKLRRPFSESADCLVSFMHRNPTRADPLVDRTSLVTNFISSQRHSRAYCVSPSF